MLHTTVYCVQTGEFVDLHAAADTSYMRATYTYVSVNGDRVEQVVPCGGYERRVNAYWRGMPGGETRMLELYRQARANASYQTH